MKASSLTATTLDGRSIEIKPVLAKAAFPIVVRVFGSVTEESAVQPSNADSPISVIPSTRVIVERLVQLLNAPDAIITVFPLYVLGIVIAPEIEVSAGATSK